MTHRSFRTRGAAVGAAVGAAFLCFAVLASCGTPPAAEESSPLADTEWRLVEILSVDGSMPRTRPDDRSKYTMRLARDGTVTMQLNCNRAVGNWKAKATVNRSTGQFEFGPLAGTRALCPPPSLDERILARAAQVRGYSVKDGRLTLNLMANAGALVWEPAAVDLPFLTVPDPALEAAILSAAPHYTRALVDAAGGSGRARYVYARIDLNGDGKPEVFAFMLGSVFCGTGGCNLMLFTEKDGRYTLVNDFPISRPPVIVAPHTTRGWNDLIRVESGGGGPATYLLHKFDGQRYVPAERTPIGETSPEGRRVLAGELGPKVGVPLVPQQ